MKIRSLLPILVLAAQTTTATTFKLPKDAPLFSIAMPDNWLTEEKGDVITSRPEKDSKTVVSVFPVPAAKDLQDALKTVSKQLASQYQDYSIGEAGEEKEAGIMFRMAEAKGKRDGAEIRILLFTFSPDDQRYFGVSQTVEPNSVEKYGGALDGVMASIRSFKEEARKAREAHDKATSVVPFPKNKPAFTMEIPNGFETDATPERLIIKTKKEHNSFFQVGAVPTSDGVADEATAKAWMPKKAQALLKALGAEDATSFSGVQDYGPPIAGHKAFRVAYSSDAIEELELWVFTPDGKAYFYAYFQRKVEDYEEKFEDDYPLGWQTSLVMSIETAK